MNKIRLGFTIDVLLDDDDIVGLRSEMIGTPVYGSDGSIEDSEFLRVTANSMHLANLADQRVKMAFIQQDVISHAARVLPNSTITAGPLVHLENDEIAQ